MKGKLEDQVQVQGDYLGPRTLRARVPEEFLQLDLYSDAAVTENTSWCCQIGISGLENLMHKHTAAAQLWLVFSAESASSSEYIFMCYRTLIRNKANKWSTNITWYMFKKRLVTMMTKVRVDFLISLYTISFLCMQFCLLQKVETHYFIKFGGWSGEG